MINKIKKTKENKIIRYILKTLELIVTIAIISISLIILIQRFSNNQITFLGYRIFKVETGSMIPKYQIGDVILVKEKDIKKINVGEDLVYEAKEGEIKGKTITHQVVRVEQKDGKTFFYTKGIANTSEDPEVSEEQVNGVVQHKLYILTFICYLLNNKYTFYFLIILPLTIYIFFRYIHYEEHKRKKEQN